MSLPKRFIDEGSDADDFERSVLGAELEVMPPEGAEKRVLASVLSAVAPALPTASLPTGAAASAKSGGVTALAKTVATLGFGKGFVVGIGVSVAAAGGSHLLGGPSPFESARSSNALAVSAPRVAATVEARLAPLPSSVLEPRGAMESPAIVPPRSREASGAVKPLVAPSSATPRTPAAPSVASFPADERSLVESRLKEEAALLRRARAELRSGALAAAFATLEASRQKFTAPALSQEREALVIELLYRSGERAVAAARAREFLARFPESPHAAAVRTFAGDAR